MYIFDIYAFGTFFQSDLQYNAFEVYSYELGKQAHDLGAAVGVGVCVIDPHAPAWYQRTHPALSLDNIAMEMTAAPPSKHLASANH